MPRTSTKTTTKKKTTKKASSKFWEAEELLKEKPDARYYFILSMRSSGKTYSVLRNAIRDQWAGKGMFAYVRRHDEYIKPRNVQELFSPQNIEELTDGTWNKISFWRGFFYYEKWEPNEETGIMERVLKNPEPCGIALAVNTWEGNKGQDIGAAHGGFKHIIYDEAITGQNYLVDEFQKFKNVISSLVRTRTEQDTKIWFLANPLSRWCPYFPELGITKQMIAEPGHRYEIKYPDTDMTTIFEYIGSTNGKVSIAKGVFETFFAFPNSKGKSKSITDGFWELDDAVHLPSQIYKNSELVKEVFLYFGETWVRGQVMRYYHDVQKRNVYYLNWTPSREPKQKEYYFVLFAVPDPYAIIGTRTGHPLAKLLNDLIAQGQVYYSDNSIADMVHGFMKEAMKIVR